MSKFILACLLVLSLSGCATTNANLAKQMAGVAVALQVASTMPIKDAKAEEQFKGWATWGATLLSEEAKVLGE